MRIFIIILNKTHTLHTKLCSF